MGHPAIIGLFAFTVFAGLVVAVWEMIGITRELKRSEPENGPSYIAALCRRAQHTAYDIPDGR